MKITVKSVHIHIINIFYYIMCFVLCTPDIMKTLGGVYGTIYNTVALASFMFVITLLLIRRNIKRDYYFFIFIAFLFWLIISDIVTGSFNIEVFTLTAKVTALYFMLDFLGEDKAIKFLTFLYRYCYLLVIINVITQHLYPKGIIDISLYSWQKYYFLKNANSFIFYYLFTLVLGVMLSFYNTRKIKISVYILVFLEIVSYLKGGEDSSTAGLFTIILCIFLMFLLSKGVLNKLLYFIKKHFVSFFIIIMTSFLLIVFSDGIKYGIVFPLINKFTNDEISFKARTYIWYHSILLLLNQPLFGYGTLSGKMVLSVIDQKYTSSHNNYLEIANFGGFPAIILYIMFIIQTFKELRKNGEVISNVCVVGLMLFMIVFLVEQNPLNVLFYYLAFISVFLKDCYFSKTHKVANVCQKEKI